MRGIMRMIFLILSINSLQAQEWQWAKSWGGGQNEDIQSMAADENGNVYVTGRYLSPSIRLGNFDLANITGLDRYVVKYDSAGNVLWAKNISGISLKNEPASITVDRSGSVFVVSGFYSQTITFDAVTLRLSNSNGNKDAYVVKYDKDGNVLWAKNTQGSGVHSAVAAGVDREGNLYVTGVFDNSPIDFGGISLRSAGRFNLYLVKYNANGVPIWARKASNNSPFDSISNMTTDGQGNSYIMGKITVEGLVFDNIVLNHTGNFGHSNPFLVKYDSDGNALWVRAGVSSDSITASSEAAVDSQGNIVVVGTYYSADIVFSGRTIANSYTDRADAYMVKYDSAGNVLWLRGAGGTHHDNSRSVSIDRGDNIYFGGIFTSSRIDFGDNVNLQRDGGVDNFIVKYNASGTALCSWSASGSADKYAERIIAIPQGGLYVTGRFGGDIRFGNTAVLNSAGQDDVFIAKFKDPPLNVEKPEQESASIYPNPAKETINIKLGAASNDASGYFITDAAGKKVREGRIEGAHTQISVSGLANGFYMLNIQGAKTKSCKFIKN